MPASARCLRIASTASLLVAAALLTGAAPPQPARAPEVIYAKTCGYCHGARVAPVIRGRGLPVEVIATYVRSGPRAMPAFRPTEISNAELAALAKWINASKADPKEISE